jgi:hypothetical protein
MSSISEHESDVNDGESDASDDEDVTDEDGDMNRDARNRNRFLKLAIGRVLRACERHQNVDPEQAECSICLEPTPRPNVFRLELPCAHWICTTCAPKQRKAGDHFCPECRNDILPPLHEGKRVRINLPPKASDDDGKADSKTGKPHTRDDGDDDDDTRAWSAIKESLHGRRGLLVHVEDARSRVELAEPVCGPESMALCAIILPNSALLVLNDDDDDDDDDDGADDDSADADADADADDADASEPGQPPPELDTRECSSCLCELPRSNYSGAQWKRKGDARRCSACIAAGAEPRPRGSTTTTVTTPTAAPTGSCVSVASGDAPLPFVQNIAALSDAATASEAALTAAECLAAEEDAAEAAAAAEAEAIVSASEQPAPVPFEPPQCRAEMAGELVSKEQRVVALARHARGLLVLGALKAALGAAAYAIDEAGGTTIAHAGVLGVSLARSVVARAAHELGYGQYALALAALEQSNPPRAREAAAACEVAIARADEAATSCDRQVADPYLVATFGPDKLHRYLDHRERCIELRRRARMLGARAQAADEDDGLAARSEDGDAPVAHAARRARPAHPWLSPLAHNVAAAADDDVVDDFDDGALEAARRESLAAAAEACTEAEELRRVLDRSTVETREITHPLAGDYDMPIARARTLADALLEGGWKRDELNKNHLRFRRMVVLQDRVTVKEQLVTIACTPSDSRARANALATVRNQDEGVLVVLTSSESARAQTDGNWFALAFHQLQEKRKQAEAAVRAIESEINTLVS